MENTENEHASSTDDSDEDANGLKNAYSVGDLLGELSSDNDLETKCDGNNTDSAIQDPCDSLCPDPNLSVDHVFNVTLEEPAELEANPALEEALECHSAPDTGVSVPVLDTYSRVYDEVLTENVDQDPLERDGCLVAST